MQAERIHVRDVMRTDVVRLDPATPVKEALETLGELGFRGAPVVDGAGAVVGVVSIADLLEASASTDGGAGAERHEYYLADPLEEAFDEDVDDFRSKPDFSPQALPSGTVAEWMTTSVLAIDPGATLRKACAQMAEHRVHRLVVVEDGKLVGILTTFDVVRCVSERG